MADNEEEPTLPPMPLGNWNTPYAKRKRSTASHLFSDSSDVPVFSSDDDPAAENYAQGRRPKKRFAGPWFTQDQQPASSSKRTLQRQVDSGVFMGSDTSIDDILDDIPAPPTSRLPELIQPPTKPPPPEAVARARIQSCMDNAVETIDLSDMLLETISNDTISPLSEFVAIPDVEKDVPFVTRDPSLQLFLSRNQLTRVPGAIFDVHHLTVLSLRGNQLTELPPSIRRLVNLRELNLAQNLLKYLPMELIELFYDDRCSLKYLHLHPNPWYQPKPAESGPHQGQLRLKSNPPPEGFLGSGNRWLARSATSYREHLRAFFRARTPVEVMCARARTGPPSFRIGRDETLLPTEDWEAEPEWPAQLDRPLSKKVPSLVELCLQACLRSPFAANLSRLLDPQLHRRSLKLVEQTQEWCETGGAVCTVCQQQVIKPAAQWIEWWQIYEKHEVAGKENEQLIPFVRRACSWQCVLRPVTGLGLVQAGDEASTGSFDEERPETTESG